MQLEQMVHIYSLEDLQGGPQEPLQRSHGVGKTALICTVVSRHFSEDLWYIHISLMAKAIYRCMVSSTGG